MHVSHATDCLAQVAAIQLPISRLRTRTTTAARRESTPCDATNNSQRYSHLYGIVNICFVFYSLSPSLSIHSFALLSLNVCLLSPSLSLSFAFPALLFFSINPFCLVSVSVRPTLHGAWQVSEEPGETLFFPSIVFSPSLHWLLTVDPSLAVIDTC